MATIYTTDGETLSDGLQGCDACDEAILAAERIAEERGEDVILEDDDGTWLVTPGEEPAQPYEWPA